MHLSHTWTWPHFLIVRLYNLPLCCCYMSFVLLNLHFDFSCGLIGRLQTRDKWMLPEVGILMARESYSDNRLRCRCKILFHLVDKCEYNRMGNKHFFK